MTIEMKLAAMILVAATIGACGSDEVQPEPISATPVDHRAAAEEAARDTVLSLSDVPADWLSEPDEPASSDENPLAGTECSLMLEVDNGFPESIAFLNGDALTSPGDSVGFELNSEVSVFADEATAARVLEQWKDVVSECRDEYASALTAQATADGDVVDEIEFSELDASRVVDGAIANRLDASFNGRRIVVDLVTIRQGRIVATIFTGGTRPWNEDREKYLQIISQKAEQADGALKSLD